MFADSFAELYAAGRVPIDAVDDYVEMWHTEGSGEAADVKLHEYLGLTWSEYQNWVIDPDTLGPALRERFGRQPEITLYYEDTVTKDDDRRMVTQTTWTEPVPLMLSAEGEGHDGSTIIGALTGIHRDGNRVVGRPSISLAPYKGLACEPDFASIPRLTDLPDRDELPEVMVAVGPRLMAVTLGKRPVWDGLEV